MITLKIDGMTCGHCTAAVERALGKVPGVTRVREVNRERGEATVEGDASAEALGWCLSLKSEEARAASQPQATHSSRRK